MSRTAEAIYEEMVKAATDRAPDLRVDNTPGHESLFFLCAWPVAVQLARIHAALDVEPENPDVDKPMFQPPQLDESMRRGVADLLDG